MQVETVAVNRDVLHPYDADHVSSVIMSIKDAKYRQ